MQRKLLLHPQRVSCSYLDTIAMGGEVEMVVAAPHDRTRRSMMLSTRLGRNKRDRYNLCRVCCLQFEDTDYLSPQADRVEVGLVVTNSSYRSKIRVGHVGRRRKVGGCHNGMTYEVGGSSM